MKTPVKAMGNTQLAAERNELSQRLVDAVIKGKPEARIIKLRLETIEREISYRHSRRWKQ